MNVLNPDGPGRLLQMQVPGRLPQVQARPDIPHVLDIPRDRDILRRPYGPEKCSRWSRAR